MAPRQDSRRRPRGRDYLLALGSIALVLVYLALPTSSASRRFIIGNLKAFPDEWGLYRKMPDHEERLHGYLELNYRIPAQLRQSVPDAVVLLPPRAYLLNLLPSDQVDWADPRYVYYMAGPVRTVRWGRERMEQATYAILISALDSGGSEADATADGAAEPGEGISLELRDLGEAGAWDRVRDAYGPWSGENGKEAGDDAGVGDGGGDRGGGGGG
jgi:hypothetical protein